MPLHCANYNGHLAVVQLLLQKSADIDAVVNNEENSQSDYDGGAALHMACSNQYREHVEIVQCLLQNGANATVVNRQGKLAYDCAIEKGYNNSAQLLLKNGNDA
jgi:ankyrin repeat protein